MADVGERCHLRQIRGYKFVRRLNMNQAVVTVEVGFATPPDIYDLNYCVYLVENLSMRSC